MKPLKEFSQEEQDRLEILERGIHTMALEYMETRGTTEDADSYVLNTVGVIKMALLGQISICTDEEMSQKMDDWRRSQKIKFNPK